MPSTGSGTDSSSKYNTVIERSRNHRMMSENVPSTSSGTDSSSKYNTVIEESRNHQRYNITSTSSVTHTVAEPVEATQ